MRSPLKLLLSIGSASLGRHGQRPPDRPRIRAVSGQPECHWASVPSGAMDFQDVARRRGLGRQFTADSVPQHSLDRILASSVRGPSAGFCPGPAFLVLTGDDLPRFWAIAAETTNSPVQTAPLVIIPLSCKQVYIGQYARKDERWAGQSRWPMPFWHPGTGMATLLILLTAVDEGLGAVYFGIEAHETTALRAEFGIPDDHEPIGAIAIGHDADTA